MLPAASPVAGRPDTPPQSPQKIGRFASYSSTSTETKTSRESLGHQRKLSFGGSTAARAKSRSLSDAQAVTFVPGHARERTTVGSAWHSVSAVGEKGEGHRSEEGAEARRPTLSKGSFKSVENAHKAEVKDGGEGEKGKEHAKEHAKVNGAGEGTKAKEGEKAKEKGEGRKVECEAGKAEAKAKGQCGGKEGEKGKCEEQKEEAHKGKCEETKKGGGCDAKIKKAEEHCDGKEKEKGHCDGGKKEGHCEGGKKGGACRAGGGHCDGGGGKKAGHKDGC